MAATRSLRPVRIWLLIVALMVAVMVLVGGATRLTESGLSITEWKPVTGTLPPLSREAWEAEFAKYKEIPQYQQINRGMSLDEFKTIFFWEWGHRLLGRVIGFVFLLPLIFFWWRGYLSRSLAPKLAVLFVLGGLQGAVGWWMVASGLVDRVSVAPYRLAVHLTFAFFLFAAIIWVVRSLSPAKGERVPAGVRRGAFAVMIIAFVQVFLGAIVAGLDAGMTFTTWPLMDGHFIPGLDSLTAMEPAWRNLFENPMTSQFVHRMTAYLLLIAAILHAFQARGTAAGKSAIVLAGLVTLQAVLGILTLVHLVPIPLALAHQLGALFVIGHGTGHVWKVSARP
ncbi:heme A synthase [Terrihabitans soli]|uniref:Heme A synthase n=1 Tax=Terrihabitans soli TaxID=708113 RepID=A0A6S6QUB7_9HYPH|nr:COX15/CtaA family protein [Terrihabitans soli]BCJ90671.1 heme A synthase [Terrihabitans soli]